LICSHNYGEFAKLANLSIGDKIIIQTDYGKYVYRVTLAKSGEVTSDSTNIIDKNGTALLDLNNSVDMLYMYTCYPFGFYGATNQRYVVQAVLE
jgi:LPXTG-site transpeptidase (sortase) family protein